MIVLHDCCLNIGVPHGYIASLTDVRSTDSFAVAIGEAHFGMEGNRQAIPS